MTATKFPLVTIIEAHPERTYSLDDLEPHMIEPPTPTAAPHAPRSTPLEQTPTGDRPGDQFTRDNDSALMLEQRGWQLHHVDARSSDRHYTRPGKNPKDGPSAVVHPDGSCWVFTDASELPPQRWMDSFGLYTMLEHGGDFTAATAAIRALGYGRPHATESVIHPRQAPTAGDTLLPDGLATWYVNWPEFWGTEKAANDWLIEPVVARSRGHAIFAKAGAGKSYITFEIAVALATGRAIFQRPASDPVHVLYVDYEMTADDLRDRLEDFGCDGDTDLTHLHYALTPGIPPLDTLDGGRLLVDAAKHEGVELVVIDTTARAVAGEENDANVYRAFYRHTGMPLKQAGIAWVRLDHAGKELDKGQRGSSAKNDDVDIVWRLERRDGNDIQLHATKARMRGVPPVVDLKATETDDHGVVHVTDAPTAPTGTHNVVVPFLVEHDVPLNAGRPAVRKLMKQHGISARNDAISYALRIRREQAAHTSLEPPPDTSPETAEKLSPDHRGQGEVPSNAGQAEQPLSPKAGTARDSTADGRGHPGLSHMWDSPVHPVTPTDLDDLEF